MSGPVEIFPRDEEARLAELLRYQILDTSPEEAFDRLTRLAAELLHVPISQVTLVDASRQWFKSSYGIVATETPRALSFCSHAIQSDEVMVVPNAQADARFADNVLVTGEPGIRFYAGAPLKSSQGYNLGTLCAIDIKPRHFTEREQLLLSDLAALVCDELELRLAIRERDEQMTELRLLANHLRDHLVRLREVETLRDNLTHMIVHDLRNPLSIVMGFMELLEDSSRDKLNEEERRYIEEVRLSASRLAEMITQLLDVNRLEQGEMPVHVQEIELGAWLREALQAVQQIEGEERLALALPGEEVHITCDPDLSRRILMNLVSNALRFAPGADGRVLVTWRADLTEATVSVTDNGRGIPEELHGRIFEKFGQVDAREQLHTTGLGLTFCKLAVQAQGGSIQVESAPGQGSTFSFTLPRVAKF